MIGAEQDYAALEADLLQELDTIEETYPAMTNTATTLIQSGMTPCADFHFNRHAPSTTPRAGVQETFANALLKSSIF